MLKWKSALQHLWSFTNLVDHNVRHCQQHMRSFGAVDVVRTRLLGTGGGEFDSWGWPWPEHRVQTVPVKLRTWIHIWQKTVLESTSHPNISEHILPLFCLHSLRYWQGEFVSWSKASSVGDHFLYSRDLNPLHPNISMHILHTVRYTFPKVLTRRIFLTIKSFFSWWSFPQFLWS